MKIDFEADMENFYDEANKVIHNILEFMKIKSISKYNGFKEFLLFISTCMMVKN